MYREREKGKKSNPHDFWPTLSAVCGLDTSTECLVKPADGRYVAICLAYLPMQAPIYMHIYTHMRISLNIQLLYYATNDSFCVHR